MTLLSPVGLVACAATTAERAAPITGPEHERRAVQRVIRLLPSGFDTPIVIIDPEGVPDSAAVRRLDAFTVVEPDGTIRQRIYLNRESLVVREAATGSGFYQSVLAAIIVHEAAHLCGGSEAEAPQAESEYFADLVRRRLVDLADGERYLALLRERESGEHLIRHDRTPQGP